MAQRERIHSTAQASDEEAEAMLVRPPTLDALEFLALRWNPTLTQTAAQVEGERAKALQAGLYPNPTIGYIGELLGVRGTAGEFQGGFIRQELVTAGKLRLSREKYLARASAAELQALAQEYRILNEVRIGYYRALGAQERVRIQRELLETAEDALVTVQELINVGQANQADLHQATLLFREQQLSVQAAENELAMEWWRLMAVVGISRPPEPLPGRLEDEAPALEWEATLRRVLAESPEVALARAKLRADELTLDREKREPFPNVTLQGSVGHNYEARDTVYGVQAAIELPLFDRNQGTIRQARADLRRQQAEVRLTELRIRLALTEAFQRYRTAHQHVDSYRSVILPEARRRYLARLQSYEDTRESWPNVLEAQQEFFRRRLIYVEQLVASRTARVAIEGYLLVDGLRPGEGVTTPGHIDAVPKPR